MGRWVECSGGLQGLCDFNRVGLRSEAAGASGFFEAAVAGGLPRVRGIAPRATEIAFPKTHEECRHTHLDPLPLNGGEDLDQVHLGHERSALENRASHANVRKHFFQPLGSGGQVVDTYPGHAVFIP